MIFKYLYRFKLGSHQANVFRIFVPDLTFEKKFSVPVKMFNLSVSRTDPGHFVENRFVEKKSSLYNPTKKRSALAAS